MNPGRTTDHQDQRTKEALIGRIAVLTELVDRHASDRKGLGLPPIAVPKLAEVRAAILAEGAVAELKRLQAELRIAEEDLEERDRRIEQLEAEAARALVSGAGVGETGGSPPRRREAPPMAEDDEGHEFMPAEDDPALRDQQTLFQEAAPGAESEPFTPAPEATELNEAPTEPQKVVTTEILQAEAQAAKMNATPRVGRLPAATKPAPAPRAKRASKETTTIEAKAAEPESIDTILVRLLRARGDCVSTSFLIRSIGDLGRKVKARDVDGALERLEAAKQISRGKQLCGIARWRAAP
jgi:hypothetical protein